MRWLALSVSAVLITACTSAVASHSGASSTSTPVPASVHDSTVHAAADAGGPLRHTGRARAELLRDNDFRVAFDDLRRLNVALDFDEIQFGVLRVTLDRKSTRLNSSH